MRWLVESGVPPDFVPAMTQLRVTNGSIAFFEETSDDLVLWHPQTGAVNSLAGRAFALGEDNIGNAATYAFDNYLAVHADPLEWLRDRSRGIVVLRWELAFDLLHGAPRLRRRAGAATTASIWPLACPSFPSASPSGGWRHDNHHG